MTEPPVPAHPRHLRRRRDRNSAYTLKTVDDEDIPELDPKGPDEKRCAADDAQARIGLAADDLAEDPGRREEFRQQWGGSPRVVGHPEDAISLGEEGGVAGDFLTEACGEFLQ